MAASVSEQADFPLRQDAVEALGRSSRENLLRLMPWYWSLPSSWDMARVSWTAFAPGYLFLLVYGAFAVARTRVPRHFRFGLFALFLNASLAPLAFNLVGC